MSWSIRHSFEHQKNAESTPSPSTRPSKRSVHAMYSWDCSCQPGTVNLNQLITDPQNTTCPLNIPKYFQDISRWKYVTTGCFGVFRVNFLGHLDHVLILHLSPFTLVDRTHWAFWVENWWTMQCKGKMDTDSHKWTYNILAVVQKSKGQPPFGCS